MSRSFLQHRLLGTAALGLAVWSTGCARAPQPVAADQRVVFGPTLAWRAADGTWTMMVQGRVYEPASDSRKRQFLIDLLAPSLAARSDDAVYRERAGYFVSDSVRNARVQIVLDGRIVDVGTSDAAGCFAAEVTLNEGEVAGRDRVEFASVSFRGGVAPFTGTAFVLPAEGVTVITDIDDTIKDTNIRVSEEAKANTFVRPFKPVEGMAELYRSWHSADPERINFHVVSAGPWQFHEPLRAFFESAQVQFPSFSWDMRCVDITEPRVLLAETVSPNPLRLYDFKLAAIRHLMQRLPRRHVVLVGDSGERDPEVYAAVVKEFKDRVDAVYIRNVSGEGRDAPRYRDIIRPGDWAGRLVVFDRAADLPRQLPAPGRRRLPIKAQGQALVLAGGMVQPMARGRTSSRCYLKYRPVDGRQKRSSRRRLSQSTTA
jgi:phosphatidate phosphatase APP1